MNGIKKHQIDILELTCKNPSIAGISPYLFPEYCISSTDPISPKILTITFVYIDEEDTEEFKIDETISFGVGKNSKKVIFLRIEEEKLTMANLKKHITKDQFSNSQVILKVLEKIFINKK